MILQYDVTGYHWLLSVLHSQWYEVERVGEGLGTCRTVFTHLNSCQMGVKQRLEEYGAVGGLVKVVKRNKRRGGMREGGGGM